MNALELFDMTGLVVVLTGAGSGLGRAMAEAVADAGALSVCTDVDGTAAEASAAGIVAGGGRAVGHQLDVTDEPSVAGLMDRTVDDHGAIDVVFCNAGISDYYRRAHELDLEAWRRVIDVNLTGVFLTAKHAARHMVPRGRGKLVLTASLWGQVASDTVPVPAYAASKGGVVNLTRELAIEYAPFGITVNALSPGFFETNIGRDKKAPQATIDALREASIRLAPNHRRAHPDEIKGAALFLASAASDLVSGHILNVDAGSIAR